MQTLPPSLTRVVSSRHSRKVSCETLTQIPVDSHSEAASFYYSDDEKDHRKESSSLGDDHDEACDLDSTSSGHSSLASHYLQQVREIERRTGKLDYPSYGDGKASRPKFLACFLSKAPHMPAARRAKEVEKLRKHLRAYPSAIHGTGGVLSHSGPILLPIGSQSGHLSSTKASISLRASASILPRNAVGSKMNPSEPSSPKVTCLGRVRSKQKKNIGKCSSVTSEDQCDVHCTLVRKRREKKAADTEVVESASKKASRMGSSNAMVDRSVELINETNTQKPGCKGTVSSRYVTNEERKRWSWRETTRQEESGMSKQEKVQASGASALGASSLEDEFAIDLSRFGYEQNQKAQETTVGNDSQRFEVEDKEDSVPAPPRNALLLIRSRKVVDNAELSSPPAAAHDQGALTDNGMDKITMTQTSMSRSIHEYDQVLSLLPGNMGMKRPVTVADILGPMSAPLTSEMESTSSSACKSERFERKLFLQAEHSGVQRQASMPSKTSSETSLWKRRAIGQPCALEIKKPARPEINRRAAVWVNKK